MHVIQVDAPLTPPKYHEQTHLSVPAFKYTKPEVSSQSVLTTRN